MPKVALLRTCGHCHWIFEWKDAESKTGCPQCGFGSYSAYSVHGRMAYKFKFTQEPWMDVQLLAKQSKLLEYIKKYNDEHYPGWDDPQY